MVDDIVKLSSSRQPRPSPIGNRFFDEIGIFRLGCGGENERRIRGRITRLVLFHRLEVTRIGDDHSQFLQLFEL